MKTRLAPLLSCVRWAAVGAALAVLTACGGGGGDEPRGSQQYPAAVPATVAGPVAGHVDRLMEIRARLGLPRLSWDARLAQAAQNHADYLTRHATTGHFEDAALAGFTGAGFAERAQRAGYPRAIGETIYHGHATTYTDGRLYLDALLESTGHRFFLLGSDVDEFGVGGTPLTTVLGRSGVQHARVAVMYPFDQQQNVSVWITLSLSGSLTGRVKVEQFSLRNRTTGAEVEVEPWQAESTGAVVFRPKRPPSDLPPDQGRPPPLESATWYEFEVIGTVDGVRIERKVSFRTI